MGVFNVRTNYSATGNGSSDDTDAISDAMEACRDAGGGEVYLPSGEYLIGGPIFDSLLAGSFINSRLLIRGDAPYATRIKLAPNLANNPTIFNVRGAATGSRASKFMLQDLTLDGNGQQATWIRFFRASLARLERVQIVNTAGCGVYGEDFWDSVFHDVLFDNVGKTVGGIPSLHFKSGDRTTNNIKLEAVQFANNPCFAVQLDQDVHVIFFLGCSFTGSETPSNYAFLKIANTSLPVSEDMGTCSLTACRFLRSGTYHIHCLYALGMTVTACTFEESDLSAIRLENCKHCLVTASNFAMAGGAVANGTGLPSSANYRNIQEVFSPSASSTNIFARNHGGSGA